MFTPTAPLPVVCTESPSRANPIAYRDGAYRSPPLRPSLLARISPWWAYYPRLVATIFSASARAKRGCYSNWDWVESSYKLFHGLEELGVQIEITGAEHLEQAERPALIVGNHMSTLETAVLPAIIQPFRDVTFVVKRSLIDYPVFRHVMRSRNPIAVSQTNPREDLQTVLEEGPKRLEAGLSLVIFPEGRRTPVFDASRFNTLGVKLAHRTGAPIVPMALKTDAWRVGKGLMADFGRIDPSRKVRFAFGPPMRVAGRGGEEQRALLDFITAHLRTWEVEDAPRG
ncbi:MAG: 1-acyl-sn-glycerol-3-phosphate acyltransferase [Planctomycetota bacterium]|nr:MAG: 1-acyl-sn-glycerol-3-phosphate acyltransferase [Planctomycetota bacterium]